MAIPRHAARKRKPFAIKDGSQVCYKGDKDWFVENSVKNYGKGFTYKIKNSDTGQTLYAQTGQIKTMTKKKKSRKGPAPMYKYPKGHEWAGQTFPKKY